MAYVRELEKSNPVTLISAKMEDGCVIRIGQLGDHEKGWKVVIPNATVVCPHGYVGFAVTLGPWES